MFGILLYVIVFTVILSKGYQSSDIAVATVAPTVKGSAYDNLTQTYYESVELGNSSPFSFVLK